MAKTRIINQQPTNDVFSSAESVDSPDQLTSDCIQSLGKKYLTKHKNPTLLHANHPIARSLESYNKESDAYEKWKYLADQYAKLKNHNGDLAKETRDIFKRAFHPKEIVTKNLSVATVAKNLLQLANNHFLKEEPAQSDVKTNKVDSKLERGDLEITNKDTSVVSNIGIFGKQHSAAPARKVPARKLDELDRISDATLMHQHL